MHGVMESIDPDLGGNNVLATNYELRMKRANEIITGINKLNTSKEEFCSSVYDIDEVNMRVLHMALVSTGEHVGKLESEEKSHNNE